MPLTQGPVERRVYLQDLHNTQYYIIWLGPFQYKANYKICCMEKTRLWI